MAADKQPTKKGRKTKRSSFLCSFGGCFGFSSKVSADHGDGKPLSARKGRSGPPVNVQHIPPPASEIVSSTKEIHVVEEDEEERSPSVDALLSNIKADTTSERSKSRGHSGPIASSVIKRVEKQKSDTWTNHRKLSHSASLPVLHQKTEKPAVKKGGKDKEAAVGSEFDSTVGAVIIMVTLVVMAIWGKVCAILCTAAWFYFIPRFRANLDESKTIKIKSCQSDDVDFDSWEYKKKVVLRGLLDRNQNV